MTYTYLCWTKQAFVALLCKGYASREWLVTLTSFSTPSSKSESNLQTISNLSNQCHWRKKQKRCKRQNGPKGWVPKSLLFSHILSSVQPQNLNQISATNFRPNFSLNFPPQLQLQNLDQTSASQSHPNITLLLELTNITKVRSPTSNEQPSSSAISIIQDY